MDVAVNTYLSREKDTQGAKSRKGKSSIDLSELATMQRFENTGAGGDTGILSLDKIGSALPVQMQENKTGLPDNVKSGVENLSGMDMSHVRVHYNSPEPAKVNAHAYTQGSNIFVSSGQERHVAHEAWHVVQQHQGRVKPTTSVAGMPVNDNAGLEREADVMGAKAARFRN